MVRRVAQFVKRWCVRRAMSKLPCFELITKLGRRGDYVPSGRLWKKNGRQRVCRVEQIQTDDKLTHLTITVKNGGQFYIYEQNSACSTWRVRAVSK